MPEEKKEKKSIFPVPFFASSERKEKEDGKKDSFTFSDKIKNSKPVPSKSFANRISSKIGSDGKPKKTLFERTRRDAPFFIAALVALLLLPFLYKYSGQVSEEPVVLPGSEESIFDPERYGFDTATGDPDGQIEQLAGRDPLSLIKGFGSQDENTADARYDQQVDRSGLSDDDSYNSSTVEENNTNVYKRQAAPATRAAFRRAATKINKIDSASMAGRSGGKLGVGMWGGNLKSAAKKIGSSAPRTSPKPVSLQPLQAAGKPSRSYFGQGAAAEARRSKDAMSKANAMQALRDAAMKPVEPGKIGGLGGGAFGPGGGNGKLDRHFTWNGKEPWWWDMMKKRSQMKWEKKFNRHWNWIEWGDKLAQKILGGILNCLITGKDDGGMGRLFGTVKDAGDADKCGKMTQKDWDACPKCQEYGPKMTKAACQTLLGYTPGDKNKVDPWKGGDKANADLNFFQVRWDCLTEGFGKRSKGKSEKGDVKGDCSGLATDGIYRASYSSQKGEDRKYFSYVVGIPTDKVPAYYEKMQPTEQRKQWVVGAVVPGTTLNLNLLKDRKNFVPLFVESVAVKPKKVNNDGSKVETKKDADDLLTEEALPKKDKGADLTYDALIATLAKGGVFYDTRYDIAADSNAATKGTAEFSLKGGKKGKDWIVGGRCQVPFARVTCENFALTGPKEKPIYPFAHIQFANGVTKEQKTYDTLAKKFRIVYRVLQGDDYGKAWKNDHETGVYIIPHNGVEKYNASWFKGSETTGDDSSSRAGWVTYKAGIEKRDVTKDNEFQVIAAGEKALVKEQTDSKGNVTNRDVSRVIKWEIYQCDNADIAGDSLKDGGCDNGLWPKVDKDGNVIGTEGQKLPGVVLSTAVCEYGRSGDDEKPIQDLEPACQNGEVKEGEDANGCPWTSTCVNGSWGPTQLTNPDCVCKNGAVQSLADNPDGCHWEKKCVNNQWAEPYQTNPDDPKCKGNGVQPLDKVRFYTQLTDIPAAVTNDTNRPGRAAAQSPARWQKACKINGMSNIPIGFADDVEQYMREAVVKYNSQTQKTAVMASYDEQFSKQTVPTIASVVDAMRIMQESGGAQVSLNTVCALAKTIGRASTDPYVKRAKPNQKYGRDNIFGTFAAYIDEDSSFFPGAKVIGAGETSSRDDVRFLGCRKQSPSGVGQEYHYGHYNWNEHKIGDQAGGGRISQNDREPYVAILNAGPWQGFPLQAIGAAVSFNRESDNYDRNRSTNGTIDDQNRRAYHEAYYNVFKSAGSCGLTGTMNVSDALTYVESLCQNGSAIKPQNGSKIPCGAKYRASTYNVTQ